MFDYKLFFTLLLSIFGLYIPIFFSLKNEIDDIRLASTKSVKSNIKIYNKKKLLTLTSIFAVILIIIALFISYDPLLKNINSSNSNMVVDFFAKTLPLKKEFFENNNFAFSFITEIFLAILFVAFLELMIYFTYSPFEVLEYVLYIVIFIVTFILLAYILLWFNYFISNFLSTHITQYFKPRSLLINIFTYYILVNISLIISNKINDY